MPFYYKIDSESADGRRTAERLLAIRQKFIDDGVPQRTLNDTLLLATWNIREFDSAAYGDRLEESMYYIAEIISHFDIIAIQEVRENLRALDKIRDILGSFWKYVVTDVTEGKPGNRERLAFLFDSRKVRFGGVAGELVIPPVAVKGPSGKTEHYNPSNQLYRTPFLVGFKTGWFKFMLCTVHMIFGKSKADDPRRIVEIRLVADFLAKRSSELSSWSRNLILLGDFNIFQPDDPTMQAITDAGFTVPEKLQDLPATNIGKKERHYDQIAFKIRPNQLEVRSAGVFDYYDVVFTDDDETTYATHMGHSYEVNSKNEPRDAKGKKLYYRTYWRTHQMSDHLLMWVELGTDFGVPYLMMKAGEG